MKIMIQTQVQENYGAHDWDGTGECPQYWKFKGGSDYFFKLDGVKQDEFFEKKCEMIVDALREKVECSNEGFREYIIGWSIEEDSYLTEYEKSQMEYEGEIIYGAIELELETV